MKSDKTYLIAVATVFVALAIVFDTFPRSTVSELEKRRLKTFPVFTSDRLKSGAFTSEVSSWFSDSEPYRDMFMALSMQLKDLIRLSTGESVTFHASQADVQNDTTKPSGKTDAAAMADYVNRLNADDEAKIAHDGIIIVGKAPNVRALMAFGGGAEGGTEYARVVNLYKSTFPKANVYAMVIPIPIEFYCPDQVRKRAKPQRPTIENIHAHLAPTVKVVDAYTPLATHAAEDIYLRTDHHWTSLGAYYAAQAFAKVAAVPFPTLQKGYRQHTVRRYVGSMYGYSHDIAVKQSPEDFVYYSPIDSSYTTTYISYEVSDGQVSSESRPYKGPLFYTFRDGSPHTYCTYLGSDATIAKIQTRVKNNRRLLIIKDSFGNILPGYMTYSFSEIHVADFRYFTKNMRQYITDNHITDILIALNIFNAYSPSVAKKIEILLEQKPGIKGGERKVERGEKKMERGERKVESGERKVERGEKKVESGESKEENGEG